MVMVNLKYTTNNELIWLKTFEKISYLKILSVSDLTELFLFFYNDIVQ